MWLGVTWADGWVGLWGRLRVAAALRHSAAFDGTATCTAGSKGTGALGSQHATMGLGKPGLWDGSLAILLACTECIGWMC